MFVQAAPLLEKAIEIYLNFAMVYAKLAVVNNNIGLFDKRDEYAKRALSLVDRLTARQSFTSSRATTTACGPIRAAAASRCTSRD